MAMPWRRRGLRGTGGSEGEYTQNFELLAADAAHALDQARSMTTGRVGRAGFFGGSQGGWVAPRAATLTKADFVAVGFGLVASPIEEDREQLVSEVRAAGHDRMIVRIRPEDLDAWLSPDPSNLQAIYDLLDRRPRPFYRHRLADEA